MNKNYTKLVAVLAAIMVSASFAQNPIVPHFTDSSIAIVLPKDGIVRPQIRDGMITILYGNLQLAYVNAKGEYVFGTDFPISIGNSMYNSGLFSGGAVLVYTKEKPDDFTMSPTILYPDGKYRYLPTKDFLTVSQFENGVALAQRGTMMSSRQIFIDKNGKEIFPALVTTQKGSFGDTKIYPLRENRRVYYDAQLQKYGYADEKGNIAIKPQYEKAADFSDGLAAVQVEAGNVKKWGYIDKTGKLVVPATYVLRPGKFSEGVAAVRIGDADYDYESSFIDKTGKRLIENKKWAMNGFHGGFAWVRKEVCDKLVVIDREFNDVKDITATFTEYSSPDVCSFSMQIEGAEDWGFEFENGEVAAHSAGVGSGDIYTPNGDRILRMADSKGRNIHLSSQTEGGLYFAKVNFEKDSRFGGENYYAPVFVNAKGEIVYYFKEGKEGYEGKKPVLVK
jgi:hypothetical protein